LRDFDVKKRQHSYDLLSFFATIRGVFQQCEDHKDHTLLRIPDAHIPTPEIPAPDYNAAFS
jgi:hypothetical protein